MTVPIGSCRACDKGESWVPGTLPPPHFHQGPCQLQPGALLQAQASSLPGNTFSSTRDLINSSLGLFFKLKPHHFQVPLSPPPETSSTPAWSSSSSSSLITSRYHFLLHYFPHQLQPRALLKLKPHHFQVLKLPSPYFHQGPRQLQPRAILQAQASSLPGTSFSSTNQEPHQLQPRALLKLKPHHFQVSLSSQPRNLIYSSLGLFLSSSLITSRY